MGLVPLLLIVLIFVAIPYITYSDAFRIWIAGLVAVTAIAIIVVATQAVKTLATPAAALVLAASLPVLLGSLFARGLQTRLGFGAVILSWILAIIIFSCLAIAMLQHIGANVE